MQFDPALARNPPPVAAATLELLGTTQPEGNALLRVQFLERPKADTLVVHGGFQKTLLRDDGRGADERARDGIFSAFVNIDVAQFEEQQKRQTENARKIKTMPVFEARGRMADRFPPHPTKLLPHRVIHLFPIWLDYLSIDPDRSLMITDVSVVEDPARTFEPCTSAGTPMGPWTFGKLMTEIANEPVTGVNPSDFVLQWLLQWDQDRVINSFTVPNRSMGLHARFLDPWPKLADGRLDLAQAPFRLLAIVNRIDLRDNTFYGGTGAGEARLVFGAVNCSATSPARQALQFLVIFEYGIKRASCAAVREWAQQWQALSSSLMILGAPVYNAALQAITDQFTLRNADPSKLPNRSALNQLRTNEFELAEFPFDSHWELRESRICDRTNGFCAHGQLEHVTMAQTPDVSFQFSATLRDFMIENTSPILLGKHTVPLDFPLGMPFRGGGIQPGAGFAWAPATSGTVPGVIDLEARHRFALATCNGCHTVETFTRFTHIKPRQIGDESQLSDFLTGANQPTHDINGLEHTFHDLLDRQMKLDLTANLLCKPPLVARRKFDFPFEDLSFRRHSASPH